MTNINVISFIEDYLKESNEVQNKINNFCQENIIKAVNLIVKAYKNNNKLFLIGNGGSAAECQHIAAEFINSLSKDIIRKSLPAIALTTDTSVITAYANDYDYSNIFVRQLEGLANSGDILFAISTSGNSKNIINAIEYAIKNNIYVISLIGDFNTSINNNSTICIKVPSKNTQFIQECNIVIEHIICSLVEKIMFC
jgi:D-sedoheptulose 7-phosphate isomerase